MKPRVVIALAITAAAVRLVPLQWLHPLNWDELEFYRATKWIAEGLVPFRDFWEHHTPLTWFAFAPFAALTSGEGVLPVIAMRWAQVPVWIGVFWLINVWMRRAGIEVFARWTAMAIALASSLLMIPAIEFRVDPLAILVYVAGLVLAQRGTARASFFAGFVFCLSAFANLRMGPLLVVTVLLLWLGIGRMGVHTWIPVGGFAALGLCLSYFAITGSFDELWRSVITENRIANQYSPGAGPMFLHRLLVPFGIGILGGGRRLFEPATIDIGGIAVIVLTIAGFAFAARRFRERGDVLVIAVAAAANILFIAAMKFVFVYHFMIAVVLAVPLIALAVARIPPRAAVVIAAAAWCVNLYGSVLRGKELDLAYQERILREVHARTAPHERVWSGGAWVTRREPAYRIFFLHENARVLVKRGLMEPYRITDPPAAIVFDHNAYVWLMMVQPELTPYLTLHYLPVWRNLWIPAPNALVQPSALQTWSVPRDGVYRVYTSESIVGHPWFRAPLPVNAIEQRYAARLPIRLPERGMQHPALRWTVDGRPLDVGPTMPLRKGQRVAVMNGGNRPVAVFLIPGNDRLIFRQPPPGVTLEASSPRVTHWPRIGVRLP